jgi:hypothetical protein
VAGVYGRPDRLAVSYAQQRHVSACRGRRHDLHNMHSTHVFGRGEISVLVCVIS